MRLTRLMAGVAAGLLALPSAASAQTIQERIDTIEKKVDEQNKSIGGMLGIDFHAMVSTQYTYSFNRPDSGNIEYRVFDTKDITVAATVTPMDILTLGLDLNWATESDIALEDGAIVRSNYDASWYGAAGYVVVKATDALSFALRAELFDDPDGTRSPFQADGHARA